VSPSLPITALSSAPVLLLVLFWFVFVVYVCFALYRPFKEKEEKHGFHVVLLYFMQCPVVVPDPESAAKTSPPCTVFQYVSLVRRRFYDNHRIHHYVLHMHSILPLLWPKQS
jgi:hypothetical protein